MNTPVNVHLCHALHVHVHTLLEVTGRVSEKIEKLQRERVSEKIEKLQRERVSEKIEKLQSEKVSEKYNL
jgi:hypothetical protein